MNVIWPGRKIKAGFALSAPVNCDSQRVSQLFSNLLSNALKFGKPDEPVEVIAESDKMEFRLSVCNTGNKIPQIAMHRLFKPFSRVEVEPGQQGLGLGLYISSEIAKAHGGTIAVTSADEKTCFTFTIS